MSKIAYVIDVESGNLQSLNNAIELLGWTPELVATPAQLTERLAAAPDARVFLPGVGNFGHFLRELHARGFAAPVHRHVAAGGRLMGICVGLQALFAESQESPESRDASAANGARGLAYIDRALARFDDADKSVPHIGWNTVKHVGKEAGAGLYGLDPASRYYFVNSYAAILTPEEAELARQGRIGEVPGFDNADCGAFDVALTTYGAQTFVSAVAFNNTFLTQFHPEKCGRAGVAVIRAFLEGTKHTPLAAATSAAPKLRETNGLTSRVVACLDVRTNDTGDLVVTKGDQYDVRERATDGAGNPVRNLGKPVELAQMYYEQGADEVTFLNITSFRNSPLRDQPMLTVLREASKTVFVPLTVGGGIRDTLDPETNTLVPALDVAALYFRSGADKVSIGSDAVAAAEAYYARGGRGDGTSPIETISRAYGAQAVVISVDPRKVYVNSPADAPPNTHVSETAFPGPAGERYVWYQCTVRGGREARPLGVHELLRACEALGAGEILLNSIDKDGSSSGFDLELVRLAKAAVRIPVIASSGAGCPAHFVEVFEKTNVDAALGAGIFHRKEYTVDQVKQAIEDSGIAVRRD